MHLTDYICELCVRLSNNNNQLMKWESRERRQKSSRRPVTVLFLWVRPGIRAAHLYWSAKPSKYLFWFVVMAYKTTDFTMFSLIYHPFTWFVQRHYVYGRNRTLLATDFCCYIVVARISNAHTNTLTSTHNNMELDKQNKTIAGYSVASSHCTITIMRK